MHKDIKTNIRSTFVNICFLKITATTTGTTRTVASSAMQTIDYKGPMGVLILGLQDEYIVEDPVAAVKYVP